MSDITKYNLQSNVQLNNIKYKIDNSNVLYQEVLNSIADNKNEIYLSESFDESQNFKFNVRDLQLNILENENSLRSNNNQYYNDLSNSINNNIKEISYNILDNKNFLSTILYDNITISNESYTRNKLYLRANYYNNISAIFDTKKILVNKILYLTLNTGSIIKRSDKILDNKLSEISLFESYYDSSNNAKSNTINTININDQDLKIIDSNINKLLDNKIEKFLNLFPPTDSNDISDNYSYLNCGNNSDLSYNFNFTYNYRNKINSYNNTLTKGVESSNDLFLLDQVNPYNYNLLNTDLSDNIDYNNKCWFTPDKDLNESKGHLVGQFVFSNDANGYMAYQYFYNSEVDEDIVSNDSNNKLPYTLYINIVNGVMQFPNNQIYHKDLSLNFKSLDISNGDFHISRQINIIYNASDICNNIFFDLSNSNEISNLNSTYQRVMSESIFGNFLNFKPEYKYEYLFNIVCNYFKDPSLNFYYKYEDNSFCTLNWNDSSYNIEKKFSIIITH